MFTHTMMYPNKNIVDRRCTSSIALAPARAEGGGAHTQAQDWTVPLSGGLLVGHRSAHSGVRRYVRALPEEVRMLRLICALILVLLIATPSPGQQSLVGTYKVISQDVQVNGSALQPLGKAPHGYVVITPTRYVSFFTGDTRKFGTSAEDKAALLDTLVGWSGTYRIEGSRIIIAVDASWTEVWNGKDQVRNWTLSGNRLMLIGDPSPFPRDPSKTAVVRQVLERVE